MIKKYKLKFVSSEYVDGGSPLKGYIYENTTICVSIEDPDALAPTILDELKEKCPDVLPDGADEKLLVVSLSTHGNIPIPFEDMEELAGLVGMNLNEARFSYESPYANEFGIGTNRTRTQYFVQKTTQPKE